MRKTFKPPVGCRATKFVDTAGGLRQLVCCLPRGHESGKHQWRIPATNVKKKGA